MERSLESNELKPLRNEVLVKCDDLIKIYKRGKVEVVALRGLDAMFYRGEITLIMGPSGCGKTTLLNLLGALDTVTSGRMIYKGKMITNYTETELENHRREHIGFIFQFLNLIPELTAEENVKLPSELSGKKVDPLFIDEIFDIIGLSDRKHHRPDELSGGEQQRIAIACALANNPELLLCDEPTGELDTESKIVIMRLMQAIIRKYPEKAIVIVSHDPELKMIADRMYFIKDGKISHKFSPEEMKSIRSEDSEFQDVAQGKSTIGADKSAIDKNVLIELREIEHFVKEKIEKISKKVHPM